MNLEIRANGQHNIVMHWLRVLYENPGLNLDQTKTSCYMGSHKMNIFYI